MDFTLIGIPIDCSGAATGVEKMPNALRQAGLASRLHIDDRGDWPVGIHDASRDPVTGIIGFADVCATTAVIRDNLLQVWQQGKRPFLVGGCCTLLIGVAAALKQQYRQAGLLFVDGHLDFYNGRTSPTGEAADMELAIITGYGPPGLIDAGSPPPLIDPANIVVVGYRDATIAAKDGAPDPAIVLPQMRLLDATAVKQQGSLQTGMQIGLQLSANTPHFWLHIDLDVLDEAALPAVDYPMPGGLSWEELVQLLLPLSRSPHLVGVDVTIYNPTLDADGRYAHKIVNMLCELFAP